MSSLNYEEVFNDFLGYVTDYDFSSMSNTDVYTLMSEYLHKSVAQPQIRRLFSSIKLDDEIQYMTFEFNTKVDDDSDVEFIKNVLSKQMIVEWLTPQVRNKINISQFFGGKEQKFYAQSNHISELRGLLEDSRIEVRKLIRDRGYIYNSYLEET